MPRLPHTLLATIPQKLFRSIPLWPRIAPQLVLLPLLSSLLFTAASHAQNPGAANLEPASSAEILPGVEVLARDHTARLAGKRVGILTNPTGVTRDLRSTIDVVRALPGVEVVRLFAPEHGLRGLAFAGDQVADGTDPVSGLPVVSLYGATRKPTAEMLAGLDVVLYDIQDVSHRSYTFVSSLTYLMEACAAAGVAVWVLDRPDPMGGTLVGGPMIDRDLLSFIGIHAVPLSYGMTPGEWARMIQAERAPGLELEVIPLSGWRRGMLYGDLGWPWVPPSQHIPHWQTAFFYAMTGTIGETRKLNEGVGTPTPFELLGAPGLDGQGLASAMNARQLPGVLFRATSFTPKYGTLAGAQVHGVQIHVLDYRVLEPSAVLLALMAELVRLQPDAGIFTGLTLENGNPSGFLKAIGKRRLAEHLAGNGDPGDFAEELVRERQQFLERRSRYLLYP